MKRKCLENLEQVTKKIKMNPTDPTESIQLIVDTLKMLVDKQPSKTLAESNEEIIEREEEIAQDDHSGEKLLESIYKSCQVNKTNIKQVNLQTDSIEIHPSTLSPNPLDIRFELGGKSNDIISIMKTKAYEEIEEFFEMRNEDLSEESLRCLLWGSVGIGKSFSLAQKVIQLRQEKKFLVFYINNPSNFSTSYFLKEFLYTILFA